MTQITITQPDICDQLSNAEETVELVAPDGRKLGIFRPAVPAQVVPPLTIEELQRRTARPGGKTTAEVLESLGRF